MNYPHVENGWVILDSRGHLWDEHLYPTKEAAGTTAARCMTEIYSISEAKRVSSLRQITTTTLKEESKLVLKGIGGAE